MARKRAHSETLDANDDLGGDLDIHSDLPPYQYTLVSQMVELEIDFMEKCIHGTTVLQIHTKDRYSLEEIALDARDCEIDLDKIKISRLRNGQNQNPSTKAQATYNDPYQYLDYPSIYRWNAEHAEVRKLRMRPLARTRDVDVSIDDRKLGVCTPVDGALRIKAKVEEPPTKILIRRSTTTGDSFQGDAEMDFVIEVPFRIKNPRDGIHFVGVEPGDARYMHAYTRHSYEAGTACCIFPCIDDAGARADWRISIKCPRTLGDALNQKLVTQHRSNSPEADNDSISRSLSEEDKMLEMTVVCSGLLTDEVVDADDPHKKIMTFESEKPISAQMIGFAVGPFEHVDLHSEFRTEESDERLGASAVKVHGYCLPKRADLVRNTCVAMATAADYLALTFSAYPFDSYKLCFVEDMVDETTPLYSFSFISTRLLHPDRILDTAYDVTKKLVYTLACQWSGIGLLPNTRRDRWATVGVAHFMTDLFMRKIDGKNGPRYHTKIAMDELAKKDVCRPSLYDLGHYLHVGDFEREFMDLKAPLVLFILDKRIFKWSSGRHSLTQILSRIFTKAQIEGDDTISTKSLRRQCEKSTKMDLESFWKEWIYRAGCPKFEINQKFNKKRLAVEIAISQRQTEREGKITKEDFLRRIKEKQYRVPKGEFTHLFTGPITIRIHEADGTPYEHMVEIRPDTLVKGQARFEIPYNTKYKRLKRRREKKAASGAAAVAEGAAPPEDGTFYCLGDTISTPDEIERYRAQEFDEATEKLMDNESYEWLRIDTDFEWLCSMDLNMQGYMYVSQLQQDLDVVAQQMSVLRCARENPHSVVSTYLTRTLVDKRYYYGIRTLAAEHLPKHATEKTGMLGEWQLRMAFRDMFCMRNSNQPRPNDFSDGRQYFVQKAIPTALAQIRDGSGKCPIEAKRFILDQLRHNNNSENEYSDDFYVAALIRALGASLVVERDDKPAVAGFDAGGVDAEHAEREREEEANFQEEALQEIERYLKRDEWTNSYHNVWTVAGLDAKQKLMKAGMIPVKPLDFIKYLQDMTCEDVRIKSWEALVDLGQLLDPDIFAFFMVCLSTDRSPYVRDRLMKILCQGLASIATGEYEPDPTAETAAAKAPSSDAVDADADADADDDGGIQLVNGDAAAGAGALQIIGNEVTAEMSEKQRLLEMRKNDLPTALRELKKDIEEKHENVAAIFKEAVWKAIDSPYLGRAEKITLVELCATMFGEADQFIITLLFPKKWKVARSVQTQGKRVSSLPHWRQRAAQKGSDANKEQLIMNFRSYHHAFPQTDFIPPPVQKQTEDKKRPVITLSRSASVKIKTASITNSQAPHPLMDVPPLPPPGEVDVDDMYDIPEEEDDDEQDDQPLALSRGDRPEAADSIVAQAPAQPLVLDKKLTVNTAAITSKKRKSEGEAPTPKRPKTDKAAASGSKKGKPSKIVMFKIKNRESREKLRELVAMWPSATPNQAVANMTLAAPATPDTNGGTSGGASRAISPATLPSINARGKIARKPLPSGAPSERATPTPPAGSPARTIPVQTGPAQTTPRQGSPAGPPSRPELQRRPTIKLKVKPPKPAGGTSASPPPDGS